MENIKLEYYALWWCVTVHSNRWLGHVIMYNLELQCTPELRNIILIESYNIHGINQSSFFFGNF